MGFYLAHEAKLKKHRVILISGAVNLKPPRGIKVIHVTTAEKMFKAVKKHFSWCDALIMSAAVADFRPKKFSSLKLKKKKELILSLRENPDILHWCGGHRKNKILIGFALETEELVKNAFRKLKSKNLDFIVANQVKKGISPFGDKATSVVLIDKYGGQECLNRVFKKDIARVVIDKLK
jgi:phosphopantothenoylcysteine decarboxylase/phosphopantothenate--cysteine ligase